MDSYSQSWRENNENNHITVKNWINIVKTCTTSWKYIKRREVIIQMKAYFTRKIHLIMKKQKNNYLKKLFS